MEKEVVKEKLCRENKVSEENRDSRLEDTPTPPKIHKSSEKLFEAVAHIYKIHSQNGGHMEFPVKTFKSLIALYFGFHERNVGPRFNLLESLGIIRVVRPYQTKTRLVYLNPEKILKHYEDQELREILSKKGGMKNEL